MERKKELTMKIYPPLPLVADKVVVLGGRQNSVCGLSLVSSRGRTIADDLNFFRCAINHSYKNEKKQELTTKIYPLLPLVVGKAVVLGGRQNSVCGLSFGRSRGRTFADDSKIFKV